MAHRVLLYTATDDEALARNYLHQQGLESQIELTCTTHEPFSSPSADELMGYEAVLGELMPVRGETVDAFASAGVKLIASMSIGLNHMDVDALSKRSILVSNCPGYCAKDVSLHAISLMLDLMRQVSASNRQVRQGRWNPRLGYKMHRPQGQTLGLVFFGNIAREVVPLAQALGMRVLVWAPTKSAEALEATGCERAGSLEELLQESDVVSLHCPLIPETQGLIGARELALMKPTAFLVNTSRGGVIDEGSLADALETGVIQGAALDVLRSEEEGALNTRLIQHERCLVTPHTAYVSYEADGALVSMGLDAVRELLIDGRDPTNAVNADSLPRA